MCNGDDENGGAKVEANSKDANRKAAHTFLSELRTRVATQALPFAHGDEATALKSLHDLFSHARAAIKDNPGCKDFADRAVQMLNDDLRPFTSEWHRRELAGELATRDGGVEFRTALAALRKKLIACANEFYKMAYDATSPDEPVEEQQESGEFSRLVFGIPENGRLSEVDRERINASERQEINARRGLTEDAEIFDAAGLALSGGGIRSASFSLGVAQVLAKHRVLDDFDLISTVSGGGYTGAFLVRRIAEAGNTSAVAQPDGPDPEAIRHLRQRASYLATGSFGRSVVLMWGLFAGMVLNWTAPAAGIAILAIVAILLKPLMAVVLPYASALAGGCAALGFLAFAGTLRFSSHRARIAFAAFLVVALAILTVPLLSWLYALYGRVTPPSVAVAVGALIAVALLALPLLFPFLNRPLVRHLIVGAGLLAARVAVPLLGLALSFLFFDLGQLSKDAGLGFYHPLAHASGWQVLLILAGALALISFLAIDINRTGPQQIYRDGLARTFVALDDNDIAPVPLSELDPKQNAPYLLMNAVVNLPNAKDVELRERKGDFFLFSKRWCGSPIIGYEHSCEWKQGATEIDLAAAVATSGAALAPHMALLSVRPATALLSFLNLRLGLWLRRPTDQGRPWVTRPGPLHLLQEMFSFGMDKDSDWLMLTDGSHLENSGVFELLRRRCKFIVAVDACAEADEAFDTLMTLVRHARIDLGVQIEPDLDDFRRDPERNTARAHGILCEVKYHDAGGEEAGRGLMLYFKMSLTGNESELIENYRAAHPDFPNETTIDQFFDERQFEAYRQLGAHSAESMFSEALIEPKDFGGNPEQPSNRVGDWLTRLSRTILTRAK